MKVIIVGGVAGGASCAARLRRLDENAEILMVERGPYVSYANCGLPYHVGGIIKEESSLLVATAELFRERFAIDVRTNCEAIEILPKEKKVKLRDVRSGEVTEHAYDKLVLSPGAPSIRPPLPGIDLPGIFHVRTVPDARHINEWIAARTAAVEPAKAKLRAVVVGGGFIGLEMAENLVHRGFEATVVEMAGQVLAPADEEFARAVEAHLRKHGVQLALGDGVAAFEDAGNGVIDVRTKSGKAHRADLVILAIGVRPDTALAKTAGLRSANAAASAWTTGCAPAIRTSSPWATPSRSRISSPENGASSRWPAQQTGKAGSRPMSSRAATRGSEARKAPPSSAFSAPPSPGPASARRRSSVLATAITRKSTSTRILTLPTIRAPSLSR